MKTYEVTIPIAGHITVAIEAESPEEAERKAFEEGQFTRDMIEDWQVLKRFNSGNVCHCPSPWEVEVNEA